MAESRGMGLLCGGKSRYHGRKIIVDVWGYSVAESRSIVLHREDIRTALLGRSFFKNQMFSSVVCVDLVVRDIRSEAETYTSWSDVEQQYTGTSEVFNSIHISSIFSVSGVTFVFLICNKLHFSYPNDPDYRFSLRTFPPFPSSPRHSFLGTRLLGLVGGPRSCI